MNGGRPAMVFSGGGAYGAYEVGVIKALLTGASPSTGYVPLDPQILSGTSVGAYNAAILASFPGVPSAAAARLEELWLYHVADTFQQCGNGVYRIRGGLPFEILDPGCYRHPVRRLLQLGEDAFVLGAVGLLQGARFLTSKASLEARTIGLVDLEAFVSESPLDVLLRQTVDLDVLRRSAKELFVTASDWKKAVPRTFTRQEIVDVVGTDAILASTAIPGIFPPVTIGESLYVDGGVLMNTPLKPAVRSGATSLHVIFADPRLENIPMQPVPSTVDTFYRLFAVLTAVQLRNDIAKAARINATLELLERGKAALTRAAAKAFFDIGSEVLARSLAGRDYRKLTVHAYRPRFELGGGEGLLDFSQRQISMLIARGYEDTVNHDCAVAGCAIPGDAV